MATSDRRSSAPARMLVQLPVPWAYVLVYLAGIPLEWKWPIRLPFQVGPAATLAAGIVTFALGAVIAGWGWITFHRVGTTRVPGEMSSEFVTWGPYRFTRNPMYLGLAIAYVGEALLQRHVWPLLFLPLVLAFVNWMVIPVEQANLTQAFGDRYLEYCRRVRRWL